MSIEYGESLTGNDIIDQVQGLQRLVAPLRDPDAKVTRARSVLRLLPTHTLGEDDFEISALTAYAGSADLPPHNWDVLNGVQLVGRASLVTYLYDEEAPVDSLAIRVTEPLMIGLNPVEDLGHPISNLYLPVLDIVTFKNPEAQL
jgi:hypothetical protein